MASPAPVFALAPAPAPAPALALAKEDTALLEQAANLHSALQKSEISRRVYKQELKTTKEALNAAQAENVSAVQRIASVQEGIVRSGEEVEGLKARLAELEALLEGKVLGAGTSAPAAAIRDEMAYFRARRTELEGKFEGLEKELGAQSERARLAEQELAAKSQALQEQQHAAAVALAAAAAAAPAE
mmetsp:Transcript_46762/g.150133  ORF Transcript_46762/g.150133 Transcript_46762/m.150133 type:complete len:187 (-) Transcript_46762:35-595(-)